VSVCASIAVGRERKIDCDLVLSRQVCVRYFGIRHFEGGAVGHVEGEFGLAKVGLAPVPAAQGMLAVVQTYAVPRLEHLGHAIKVVLLEAVELYHAVVPREDLDFVSARRSAPLRLDDLRLVAGIRFTVRGLPAEARVGEASRARLPRKVEVDVVERLPVPC
jgi:hypothetical protein